MKRLRDGEALLHYCSMTFCFSFDVLIKLNPIPVNIRGGGPS